MMTKRTGKTMVWALLALSLMAPAACYAGSTPLEAEHDPPLRLIGADQAIQSDGHADQKKKGWDEENTRPLSSAT